MLTPIHTNRYRASSTRRKPDAVPDSDLPPTVRSRWIARLWCDDRGSATPIAIFGSLIVLILAGLVLDHGLAMADKVRILDVAQAAARAGAQQIDLGVYRATGQLRLNPTAAGAAARSFLSRAGIAGTATATDTTVSVSVTSSRRTQLLQLIGVTDIPVAATASATPTSSP